MIWLHLFAWIQHKKPPFDRLGQSPFPNESIMDAPEGSSLEIASDIFLEETYLACLDNGYLLSVYLIFSIPSALHRSHQPLLYARKIEDACLGQNATTFSLEIPAKALSAGLITVTRRNSRPLLKMTTGSGAPAEPPSPVTKVSRQYRLHYRHYVYSCFPS